MLSLDYFWSKYRSTRNPIRRNEIKSMKSQPLLDQITTKHSVYHGIIDYSSAKNFIFYDFSRIHDPDVILMAMIWKTYYPNHRFSLFVCEFFPDVALPDPILIPRRDSNASRDVSKKFAKRKIMGKIKAD